MTKTYRFGRQRLAWFILFGSFFACLLLTITVPLAVRAFVQNATQPLDVTVQANQGTVGINAENGPRRAVLVGEPPEEVEGVTTIQTDTTASALVNVMAPAADEPLAVLQISGNSTVQVAQASAPAARTPKGLSLTKSGLGAGRWPSRPCPHPGQETPSFRSWWP